MTALLLDTSSLFFRAHHALPPMNTRAGEPTSALYGFSTLLLKLLRELRPDGVAFARDLPARTFRHAQYDAYKAGRPPMPDALRSQWKRLDELLAAFGAPSHSATGYEADDVLATLARRLSATGDDVTLVSGDRDLFQTIGPQVRVLFVGARGQKPETIDTAVVEARYGVTPAGMPMLAALVGEGPDNLVGVAGVGVRTASKLVTRFGSMANLLAGLDTVTPPKIRDALREAAARITMNEDLARLRDDVPLGEGPLATAIDDDALDRVRAVFEALGSAASPRASMRCDVATPRPASARRHGERDSTKRRRRVDFAQLRARSGRPREHARNDRHPVFSPAPRFHCVLDRLGRVLRRKRGNGRSARQADGRQV